MNRTASVVIGANFGDEGKGLITDFETRRLSAGTVSRFNGGAQAGHTVTTGDGKRHVFGHVGAGTFAGASTYLSSNFIVNPLVLDKELAVLKQHGAQPQIITSGEARVTTLFDMAINGIVEQYRDNNRHGSCGLGINETVTRHFEMPLLAKDVMLHSQGSLAEQLLEIHKKWVPARLAQLNIQTISPEFQWIQESVDYDKMAYDMMNGIDYLHLSRQKLDTSSGVVLEGAQGLMLDEYLGAFPHVTRSITGLPYALIAAKELGLRSVRPIYVTRSYLTRHGAGVLPFEGVDFGGTPVDATNINNQWQGSIRFAPLNIPELKKFIEQDLERGKYFAQAFGIEIERPSLAVTCLDQLGDTVTVANTHFDEWPVKSELKTLKRDLFLTYLMDQFDPKLGLKLSHISSGPTANDVEYLGA